MLRGLAEPFDFERVIFSAVLAPTDDGIPPLHPPIQPGINQREPNRVNYVRNLWTIRRSGAANRLRREDGDVGHTGFVIDPCHELLLVPRTRDALVGRHSRSPGLSWRWASRARAEREDAP
jgi:hypothetical protein